jgi:hypothetical protein
MRWPILISIAFAAACGNVADWNAPGIVSPGGWAKARVMELDSGDAGSSQLYISFDKGRCGAGSISATGVGLDMRLAWLDDHTLQVSVPKDLALSPAPASRTLSHRVQCLSRKVDVVVVRH